MEIIQPSKEYHNSSHCIYSCLYHVIFCTKYRRRVLSDKIQLRLKELVLEKQDQYKYFIIEMETMGDHVHLLLDVDPKFGIYKVVSSIKGYTSNSLRKEYSELRSKLPTLWTRGKFISSVGSVSLEIIKKYIENQKNV